MSFRRPACAACRTAEPASCIGSTTSEPHHLQDELYSLVCSSEDPDHPNDQVVRYRHRDGRTIWVRCRGSAIRDEQGRAIRMLGAHNDLTPLKELEEQLRKAAGEDPLTGLANRRSFDVVEGGGSASIGISTFARVPVGSDAAFMDEQICAADRAFYVAKESGRNRVAHAASHDDE